MSFTDQEVADNINYFSLLDKNNAMCQNIVFAPVHGQETLVKFAIPSNVRVIIFNRQAELCVPYDIQEFMWKMFFHVKNYKQLLSTMNENVFLRNNFNVLYPGQEMFDIRLKGDSKRLMGFFELPIQTSEEFGQIAKENRISRSKILTRYHETDFTISQAKNMFISAVQIFKDEDLFSLQYYIVNLLQYYPNGFTLFLHTCRDLPNKVILQPPVNIGIQIPEEYSNFLSYQEYLRDKQQVIHLRERVSKSKPTKRKRSKIKLKKSPSPLHKRIKR